MGLRFAQSLRLIDVLDINDKAVINYTTLVKSKDYFVHVSLQACMMPHWLKAKTQSMP